MTLVYKSFSLVGYSGKVPYQVLLKVYYGLVGRLFANGLGEQGSIPGGVLPKTLKMVLDTSLLNTQHHKAYIKDKVEQSRGRSNALSYTLVW